MGDKLPGARDARDLEIAKLGTFYSPAAGNPTVGYSAHPIFYAMMAVEQFAGSTLVATDFATGDVSANAYAVRSDRGWRVALVNKELRGELTVEVSIPSNARTASVWRLTAPAVDSIDNVALAGAQVSSSSSEWTPRDVEHVSTQGQRAVVTVRRASGPCCSLNEAVASRLARAHPCLTRRRAPSMARERRSRGTLLCSPTVCGGSFYVALAMACRSARGIFPPRSQYV